MRQDRCLRRGDDDDDDDDDDDNDDDDKLSLVDMNYNKFLLFKKMKWSSD